MTTFLICLFAGLGAGLGTGFAGMSAAAVIRPMLIAFLGIEPYPAIVLNRATGVVLFVLGLAIVLVQYVF